MAEKRKLEFFLLRYVPDVVKGEFVNIGLAMIEIASERPGYADARFTQDWRRVLCLDPDADIETLRALEAEIRQRVVELHNCESVMRSLHDSLSNVIQLSDSKGVLTEDPEHEFEKMVSTYLVSRHGKSERGATGRQVILARMKEEWDRAGVGDLVKPIQTSYAEAGAPFTFDYGYRLGREMKLFQAVSFKAGVDYAVKLAARYPKIVSAMNKEKYAALPSLTAVVDDGGTGDEREIGFATGMMHENGIQVRAMAEMPGIAETARLELRA